MVSQTYPRGVGSLYQDTGVEAQGGIVTLDFYIAVACPGQRVGGQSKLGFKSTGNAVDGRAKTNRHAIIEGIADGWLQGNNLHFAFAAKATALEAAFVVGHKAERGINAEADCPLVIQLVGVKAHRNACERHHVTFVGALDAAIGILDIGRSINNSDTACYLLAAEAGHTGRVTKNGTGIVGRR